MTKGVSMGLLFAAVREAAGAGGGLKSFFCVGCHLTDCWFLVCSSEVQ